MKTLIYNAKVYDTARRAFTDGGILAENGVFCKVFRMPVAGKGTAVCRRCTSCGIAPAGIIVLM